MQSEDRITDAERHLPLKPIVYLILFSLVADSCHGYGIKKQVEELSRGKVKLDPGTLYRWMARLLEDGFLEETDQRPRPEQDDERRRYYRLTPLGRRIVELESNRLAHLVEAARHYGLVRR